LSRAAMTRAFADWIDLIVRGRTLIAEDPAHGRWVTRTLANFAKSAISSPCRR